MGRLQKKAPDAPQPAAPALKLYKVLTADGRAPFVPDYRWSVPTPSGDGAFTLGEWHEEDASALCAKGLHLTACPLDWTHGADSCAFYEAEAEGVVGDPVADSKVIARRVRLVRPVTREEAERVSKAWREAADERRRAEDVEREKRRVRERLDRAREAAAVARKDDEARREAGIPSPALLAFKTLVELTPTASWRDVNGCRFDALAYATEYLDFDPEDVRTIHHEFGGGHWFGSGSGSDERLYRCAIEKQNTSACVAWERFFGRKPWWGADRKGNRQRLHVGAGLSWEGLRVEVTSFDDANDALVACSYKSSGTGADYSRKIERRFKVTREAYEAARKAPKKGGAR